MPDAVQMLPPRLIPSRIRLLRRNQYLLAIDRISGKWVSLDETEESFLRLMFAHDGAKIPVAIRERTDRLRKLLLDARVGVPDTPPSYEHLNTLILKLTNACNLACTYCYDAEKAEQPQVLSEEIAHRAITQALELCTKRLWVILHGGEPMLVWNLVEKIVRRGEAVARSLGKEISFSAQTNMTRLDARIVHFSLDHDIAWGISVDGPAHFHDALRIRHDGGGSYAMFLDCLNRFPLFVRKCGVMSTITAFNQGALLPIARHFLDLGMPSWDWSLFQPTGRGRDDALRLQLDSELLCHSWISLFAAVEKREFDGFAVKPITKYLDNFLRGPGHNMCMRAQCGAGRDLLSISSDGTIEACDCIDPLGPMGNLGHAEQDTLAIAKMSLGAARIRARDMQFSSPCNDCLWFGICGGTCLAHAGDIDRLWPEACAMTQCAFDRISMSLVKSDSLIGYAESLRQ